MSAAAFAPDALDATHDPAWRSWVASANVAGGDFPIQNLPYGRWRRRGSDVAWRIGVAIGDAVLDLKAATEGAAAAGWPRELAAPLASLAAGELKPVMAAPKATRVALRRAISAALADGSPQRAAIEAAGALVAQAGVELSLPCEIGDYTDFYTGIHHATKVGRLFRPDQPLMPNYHWVPIGYHGRSSSIVVSGADVRRPLGQTMAPGAAAPTFGPSRRLDHELELGAFVGPGNALGEPVAIDAAEDHLFGLVLLNDWSARDVQAWEYQPLGPFLAKNFASTISPWIVTMEALAPFRAPPGRDPSLPAPLAHLDGATNRRAGGVSLTLEVWLQTAGMRARGEPAARIASSDFASAAHWTLAQMLAHHASNGCNLRPGDLLGTGTQSGPGAQQGGSMLELSDGGKTPIALPGGETRTFLEDGDTLTLRAHAARPGAARIGFGDCAGTVRAARAAG